MASSIESLTAGDVLNNSDICTLFLCGPQGGMRRSKRTNTLVIISNPTKSIYQDRWIDGILHYTGMGMEGDQRWGTQNRTLGESQTNGVAVHLFEVFTDKQYTYVGRVTLAADPYQESQPDHSQRQRLVWMFPLRPEHGQPLQIPTDVVKQQQEAKARQARKLTDDELRSRAEAFSARPGTRATTSTMYERSAWVSEYAKRRANGVCQLCQLPAPFVDASGYPYLETHHVVWLARGGKDSIDNTVAVCPNCHRRLHILDAEADRQILSRRVQGHMANKSLNRTAINAAG